MSSNIRELSNDDLLQEIRTRQAENEDFRKKLEEAVLHKTRSWIEQYIKDVLHHFSVQWPAHKIQQVADWIMEKVKTWFKKP